MRFNLSLVFAFFAALFGCGGGAGRDYTAAHTGTIGTTPTFFSSSFNLAGADDNTVTVADEYVGRIHRFRLEPFVLESSVASPFNYQKLGVVAHPAGSYFIVTANSDWAVIKRDGQTLKNQPALPGKIKSVAYEPGLGLLILSDEFLSTALIKLNSEGDVLSSWVGGPILAEGQPVHGGTMLPDGRLLLGVGEGTIALVDVASSLEKQSWQFDSWKIDNAAAFDWLASVSDKSGRVLAMADHKVYVLDVAAKAVIASKDLGSATVRGRFLGMSPHIVVEGLDGQKSGISSLLYLDQAGNLQTKSLRLGLAATSGSLLNLTSGVVTLVGSDTRTGNYGSVWRFRLSDSLLLNQVAASQTQRMAISSRFLFVQKESLLGAVVRQSYEKEASVVNLTGFNLAFLRQEQ